jgi:heme/copper-type cytochrome/quinol oxidase subunit 2
MVHSFTLPQMRVKQDTIPGLAQPVWFTPTERGFYTIHTQAGYGAWLASEAALLTGP